MCCLWVLLTSETVQYGVGFFSTIRLFSHTVNPLNPLVSMSPGVDYRGVLACLDGYMNIALEATEEYVNGQLKSKYGDAFIRGNNVLYISTVKRAR